MFFYLLGIITYGDIMNLKKYFFYTQEEQEEFSHEDDFKKCNNPKNPYISNNIKNKNTSVYKTGMVSTSYKENLDFIKDAFSKPKNFDLVIREFKIKTKEKDLDAFLIFYDGLVNKEIINRDILNPLMTNELKVDKNITDGVYEHLITQAPLSKIRDMKAIIEMVEFGNCAIFADGADAAFVADVKGWSGRGVGKPVTEAVLSGPQEAFNEVVMTNISLVRKILKDANLVAENITVGTKSKTPCALMYINGVTNHSLVKEVKKRLRGIDTEYIFSSSDIEMFIEDSTFFPLPQIVKTERPDRAAAMLADGKVVIIVQGSPFALVLPGTGGDLVEASEDNYVRVLEANFMRFIRLMGILLALFLPCTFVATVLYHHDTLPTDLLFAMAATREQMPFPVTLELVIMLLAFELIKEASIRIPDPIGSTLGIVGGLILGQAATEAGIASPLLIIIVSIAGLGSFAVPSLSLSRALSIMQLLFVFSASMGGFLGIALSVFLSLVYLTSQKSVGVPFLSPLSPKENNFKNNTLFISPVWRRENRPENLKPQRLNKQPPISMKWRKK